MIDAVKSISRVEPPYPFEAYARIISPLSEDEGGGFLITFPDLPGCMSDGETEAEAIENGQDAFLAWVSAYADSGKAIPRPTIRPELFNPSKTTATFVNNLPKKVHAQHGKAHS
jgi:antitoxin HicB